MKIHEETSRERSMEQRGNPEMHPHSGGQSIFNKGTEAGQWEKNSLSTKGAGKTAYPLTKKANLDLSLTPCADVNPKRTIDVRVEWAPCTLWKEARRRPCDLASLQL